MPRAELRQEDMMDLMTIPEAAAHLRIAPGTLRNWFSARRLAFVKVGRLTRVRRSVLDAFIAANTIAGSAS